MPVSTVQVRSDHDRQEIRAMAKERRRFVPSTEGLEGRALMASLFGVSSPATSLTTTIDTLPENFKQKELRIAHLPFFLNTLQPGRFLPATTITSIQADLQSILGRLHAPPTRAADGFNLDLRHMFVQTNLSPDNAKILNHAIGVVLVGAGATPTQVHNIQTDMNQLALVDSKSIDPSRLAANDYGLVLQTALAVGRPILTPTSPTLSLKDGQRNKSNTAGRTHNHLPTLVGTYTEGASTANLTVMRIVELDGTVIGSGAVDKNGKYSVTATVPLADGVYKLSSQALEPAGLVSALSKPFTLRVETPPPRVLPAAAAEALTPPGGPLNLR
jgi:hypothetical protein